MKLSLKTVLLWTISVLMVLALFTSCEKTMGGNTPYIGANGNWWIDETDTGIAAQGTKGDIGATGAQGEKGDKGDKGDTGAAGEKGDKGDTGAAGADGKTPFIGENGNWWIGDTDTGIAAQGAKGDKGDKGDTGATGAQGAKGEKGDTGAAGADGKTPFIGENGNWWIGDTDTGIAAQGAKGEKGDKGDTGAAGEKGEKGDTGATGAQGEKGEKGDKGDTGAAGADGKTPFIGENGNWWIGDTDTGIAAQGAKGDKGDLGNLENLEDVFIDGQIIRKSYNILNNKAWLNGAVYSGTGKYESAIENSNFRTWWTTEYIEVESGKTYSLSLDGKSTVAFTSCLFDKNKTFISDSKDCLKQGKVIVPDGAKYIRFSVTSDNMPEFYQLQEGEVTNFEPFGSYVLIKNDNFVELVEYDNLYGAYQRETFLKDTTSFIGYATKVFDVSNIDTIKLSGTISSYVNAVTLMDENKNIMSYIMPSSETTYENKIIDVSGVSYVCVSSKGENFWNANRIKVFGNERIDSKWKGKKIVWFGTSIPAAGYKGTDNDYGYPYLVARKLGATVYNEAVGSSPMHGRQYARVSATNPYGFMASFEPASRALCNTKEQMQWIANWIDYKLNGGTYKNSEEWDPDVFTHSLPTSWTAENTADLISFSYESKLDKYLTDETFPDLFVIDHGYNDDINWSDELGYYDSQYETYGRYNPYTYRGSMNFIIDRILSFNPHARIVIIGTYDKTLPSKANVHKYQEIVADDNQLPLLKLWEKTGLTQTKLALKGKWVNGLWHATSTTQEYTVMDANLPDTIHPHSDKSGRMLRILTDIITPFIEEN